MSALSGGGTEIAPYDDNVRYLNCSQSPTFPVSDKQPFPLVRARYDVQPMISDVLSFENILISSPIGFL